MSNLAIVENNKYMIEKQAKEQELAKLIKETYAKGATDDEVKFFAQVCMIQNLDPIKRQIYFTKIWDSQQSKNVFTPIVSIDGMRSKAEETGLYAGQTIPVFCGRDGVWKEIWAESEPPFAAKVGVYRKDFKEPIYAIAQFDAYAKRTKDGGLNKFWKEMGYHMLAKCAEALALRKALPQKLSGLYTEEERAKDIVDVEYKKEEDKSNEFRPISRVAYQKEKVQQTEKLFSHTNEFNAKAQEYLKTIDELCEANLGKMDIDKDFVNSFKQEFFQYFKDEYIKNAGRVTIEDLFNKKLIAKRITVLALYHNAIREDQLDENELKELKKMVYDEYMKNPLESLTDIFALKASEYIKF